MSSSSKTTKRKTKRIQSSLTKPMDSISPPKQILSSLTKSSDSISSIEETEYMKEEDIIKPAPTTTSQADLVLYIIAHGSTWDDNIDDEIKDNFRWFSPLPINACVLSVNNSENNNIEEMKKLYNNKSNDNTVLKNYCKNLDVTGFKRDEIIQNIQFCFLSINNTYDWIMKNIDNGNFTEENISNKKGIETYRKLNLLLKKMKKSIELIVQIWPNITRVFLYNKTDINNQKEILKIIISFNLFFNRIKEDILDDNFIRQIINNDTIAEDYKKRIKIFNNFEREIFVMKNVLEKNEKFKCKFMYLKKEKTFSFTEEDNGVFIIYNTKYINNELLEPFKTYGLNGYKKINAPYFKKYEEKKRVKLSDIIKDMKELGFENIIVYDVSCNSRPAALPQKEVLSSMAHFVSGVTPTSIGGHKYNRQKTIRRKK